VSGLKDFDSEEVDIKGVTGQWARLSQPSTQKAHGPVAPLKPRLEGGVFSWDAQEPQVKFPKLACGVSPGRQRHSTTSVIFDSQDGSVLGRRGINQHT